MFKVLIAGANGQVGRELIKLKPLDIETIGFNSTELDITHPKVVSEVISNFRPDLIINAAAYTAVDKAESDSVKAFEVNEKGVINLSLAAQQVQCPLFHISTDYVFDGKSQTPYRENDPTAPIGVYGASKLAGELALIQMIPHHIILRTSWVFGKEGNNFVKTMLRLSQIRESLGIVSDQYGCPTSAHSIAHVLWHLVRKYQIDKSLPWGIYNFSNSPQTTWYEFAQEIFKQAHELKIITKTPVLKPIKTSDYPTAAKRPEWSVLNCSKIEELLRFKVPQWRDELQKVLKELK